MSISMQKNHHNLPVTNSRHIADQRILQSEWLADIYEHVDVKREL